MINDKIILDEILESQRAERAPHMKSNKFFEVFVAEQLLKDYELSYDEIEPGLVDGGGNGGIDGFFVFVNGDLVREDTEFTALKKDVAIEMVMFQAKTSSTFSEAPVIAATEAVRDLFNLWL